MPGVNLLEVGLFPEWFKYRKQIEGLPLSARTLRWLFYMQKSFEYVPPERAGTIRGERIGFPTSKHDAALMLAISNQPQKEIARLLGISHGVLRKWNTEQEFKAAVEKHRRNFVLLVVDWMTTTKPRLLDHADKDFNQQNPSTIELPKEYVTGWSEFMDYDEYPEDVRMLIEYLLFVVHEEDYINNAGIGALIFGFIQYIKMEPDSPRMRRAKIEMRNKIRRSMFEDIRGILSKPRMTRKDRMHVMAVLQTLCEPEYIPPEEGGEDGGKNA